MPNSWAYRNIKKKEMEKIDVKKDRAKYQAELEGLSNQLQNLENQKLVTLQALNERRGIIAYLDSISPPEPPPEPPPVEETGG